MIEADIALVTMYAEYHSDNELDGFFSNIGFDCDYDTDWNNNDESKVFYVKYKDNVYMHYVLYNITRERDILFMGDLILQALDDDMRIAIQKILVEVL
jgi:hypothetical protein